MKKRTICKHNTLSDEEYDARFGIQIESKNADLHKRAFEKAWDTRNFEIDKFWHRSAYFWGFIAVIFAGYFKVVTVDSKVAEQKGFLDLYLILLGLIFSVGWYLVICGSKRWQENWENHIDKLENSITGPLYKTVYFSGEPFYSVSKISKILAKVVIAIWGFLFGRCIYDNFIFYKKMFECFPQIIKFIFFVFIPIVAAFVFICLFSKCALSSGNGYKTQEPGKFFDRCKDDDA